MKRFVPLICPIVASRGREYCMLLFKMVGRSQEWLEVFVSLIFMIVIVAHSSTVYVSLKVLMVHIFAAVDITEKKINIR